MRRSRVSIVFVLMLIASGIPFAAQQTTTVTADRFILRTGPCENTAGMGTPEGNKVGDVCDEYRRIETGQTYYKISGAGTDTGWMTWTFGNVFGALVVRDGSGGFSMGPLLATEGSFANLSPSRVPFAGTAGKLIDDPTFTFVTDLLSTPKVLAPVSTTTPRIFGYGTPNTLTLGGSGAGCTSYPACEALGWTFDTAVLTQRLKTDLNFQTRWYVAPDGGHVSSYNGSNWIPLNLDGGPTKVRGNGLHVGGVEAIAPGLGNTYLDGFVGKPGYVSQTTGWRIDGLGAADFRSLFSDEVSARRFIADLEQALAGLQIVAKSVGQLGAPFTAPVAGGTVTLTMQDLPSASNQAIFESGDYLWLRSFNRSGGSLTITSVYGIVTSYTDLPNGLQSWTFTRLATDSGAMTAGTVIEADAIALDVGVPGNGWTEQNAIDGPAGVNSPYYQVVTWTGTSPIAANQRVIARFGNLRGITGTTGEHGLLAGDFAATNGKFFKCSNVSCELHGVDLLMWNGSTNVVKFDHVTPYASIGNPAPVAFNAGIGEWSGLDGGVFKWRVGNPLAQNVSFNTATGIVTVTGTINVVGGNAAVVDLSNVTGGYAGSPSPGGAANTIVGQGALATASNVNWTTNVVGRPAELIDGRIPLAINAAGAITLNVAAPAAGTGLFAGSDHLGFYDAGDWRVYLDAAGNFASGASGFGTGTGYWLSYNAGTPQFRVGNPAGDRFEWNGSSVKLVSSTVNIDTTGITLSSGVGTSNRFKFTDGNYIESAVSGASVINFRNLRIVGISHDAAFSLGAFWNNGSVTTLGLSGFPWTAFISSMNIGGPALTIGSTTTFSSNVNIAGALAVTGVVTGGTYNGQTISTAANFTGNVTVQSNLQINNQAVINGLLSVGTTLSVSGVSTLTGAVMNGNLNFPAAAGGGVRHICVDNGGTVVIC